MAGISISVRGLALRGRPDDDVFSAALSGDPVAFGEVYRRYRTRIYGFCLSLLLSPQAAEDATQEVFLRFLDATPGSISHPRQWLFTVARNACVDSLRARSASAEPLSDEAEEGLATADDAADEAIAKERAHNVFLALRRLNPRYRTALILRDIHGESSTSIAEALGTTPGAVDTLACRARDAFGRAYASVAEMQPECREVVTLAYKATGSGISEAERAQIQAHTANCAACRKEAERASDTKWLPAVLPFLTLSGHTRRVFAEAIQALRGTSAYLAECAPAFAPTVTRAGEAVVAVLAAGALVMGAGDAPAPVPGRRSLATWGSTAPASSKATLARAVSRACARARSTAAAQERTRSGGPAVAGPAGSPGQRVQTGAGAGAGVGGSGGTGYSGGYSGGTGTAGGTRGNAGGGATGSGSSNAPVGSPPQSPQGPAGGAGSGSGSPSPPAGGGSPQTAPTGPGAGTGAGPR